MANAGDPPDARKVTVTLPTPLIERLNQNVPRRQRSRFIALAVSDRLAQLEQQAVLDESAGAWKDEDHPEMLTDEDIDRWLSQLRSGWLRPPEPH
jgi:hypothetical protein